MKKQEFESDLEECKHKIEVLLKEYNAKIEYDADLCKVILLDQDTKRFECLD